jgi:DNA-binding response OmpR family regulator
MNILLIEDNLDHVFLARQAIEETWQDSTLQVARDLPEVDRLLDASNGGQPRFDVLLVALDSRDANRLAQLRAMQDCARMQPAPIIALVSSTRDQELAQVAQQPLDWIILKPLRAEVLQEAIRRKPLR